MKRMLSPRWLLPIAIATAAGSAAYLLRDLPASTTAANAKRAETLRPTLETAHYAVASSATAEQTRQVATAVEQLHAAFVGFFPGTSSMRIDGKRLQLVLYRDRAEFKAHNRSSPWAEAFYLSPTCHAYYAQGQRNPYHWMLHEATHQLSREVAGFPKVRWIDEGLASYFGASRIENGRLMPGTADVDTYPIWWLSSLSLSGDMQQDIAQQRILPLRAVIEGNGPPIGNHVNTYYIAFWSLTHFLFHYENGRHAYAYRRLIATDGSLKAFEAAIGPVEVVQAQWYRHLQEQVAMVRGGG